MIRIIEEVAFGQVITAVMNGCQILDLRRGEVSDHAKSSARFHAEKESQGTIPVTHFEGQVTHLTTSIGEN